MQHDHFQKRKKWPLIEGVFKRDRECVLEGSRVHLRGIEGVCLRGIKGVFKRDRGCV